MTRGLQLFPLRRRSLRQAICLLVLCAAASALSGCDKCGDFVWNKPDACRSYGPPR